MIAFAAAAALLRFLRDAGDYHPYPDEREDVEHHKTQGARNSNRRLTSNTA